MCSQRVPTPSLVLEPNKILLSHRAAFLPFAEKKSSHVAALHSKECRDCPTLHKKRFLVPRGIKRPRCSFARFPLSREHARNTALRLDFVAISPSSDLPSSSTQTQFRENWIERRTRSPRILHAWHNFLPLKSTRSYADARVTARRCTRCHVRIKRTFVDISYRFLALENSM